MLKRKPHNCEQYVIFAHLLFIVLIRGWLALIAIIPYLDFFLAYIAAMTKRDYEHE